MCIIISGWNVLEKHDTLKFKSHANMQIKVFADSFTYSEINRGYYTVAIKIKRNIVIL